MRESSTGAIVSHLIRSTQASRGGVGGFEEARGGAGGVGVGSEGDGLIVAREGFFALAEQVVHFPGIERRGRGDAGIRVGIIHGVVEGVRGGSVIFLVAKSESERKSGALDVRGGEESRVAAAHQFAIGGDGFVVLAGGVEQVRDSESENEIVREIVVIALEEREGFVILFFAREKEGENGAGVNALFPTAGDGFAQK